MTDSSAGQPNQPRTLAEFLETATPMGDLMQFAIDDLTLEEEDVFYGILEEA